MESTIDVSKTDRWQVCIKIDSDCDMVNQLGEGLAELDAREALKHPPESQVYKWASKVQLVTLSW